MKLTNICTNCQTVENEGIITIFSYGTPVLKISPNIFDDKLSSLTRLWGGYSSTTMRHINKALDTINGKYRISRTLALMGGYISFTKKLWESMPVLEV